MNFITIALAAALLGSNGGGSNGGGGGGDDPPVVVRCKADAELRGTEVWLRDIAEVETSDAELTARLLQVSFGKPPATGFERVLTQQDVMLRLVREGLTAARLRLVGAPSISLRPVVTRVQPSDVLEAAEPVLRAALAVGGDGSGNSNSNGSGSSSSSGADGAAADVELEPATRLSTLLVPPGRYAFELSGRLVGAVSHGSATVEVTVLVDQEPFKVVRVPYRLHRYQRVLVAARPIEKAEPLGEANLELQRVEAAAGPCPFLTGFEAVAGRVAAQDLRQGTRLTLAAVAAPAVVFRGDVVHLVATEGRIRVATRAIALADGAAGDRIPVRNLTADRVVQAVVHGQGLVVVPAAAPREMSR